MNNKSGILHCVAGTKHGFAREDSSSPSATACFLDEGEAKKLSIWNKGEVTEVEVNKIGCGHFCSLKDVFNSNLSDYVWCDDVSAETVAVKSGDVLYLVPDFRYSMFGDRHEEGTPVVKYAFTNKSDAELVSQVVGHGFVQVEVDAMPKGAVEFYRLHSK